MIQVVLKQPSSTVPFRELNERLGSLMETAESLQSQLYSSRFASSSHLERVKSIGDQFESELRQTLVWLSNFKEFESSTLVFNMENVLDASMGLNDIVETMQLLQKRIADKSEDMEDLAESNELIIEQWDAIKYSNELMNAYFPFSEHEKLDVAIEAFVVRRADFLQRVELFLVDVNGVG